MTTLERDERVRALEARDRIARISDPVVRNLARMMFGAAVTQLLRPDSLGEQEWSARLPVAPFDLDFFVRAVEVGLGDRETVARVVAGEEPDDITGWSAIR